MNALELADAIQGNAPYGLDDAARMLRQQAEQIESLNKTYEMNMDYQNELKAEIEKMKKSNKEFHAIAQRMALAESDARKSLQNYKDWYGYGEEKYFCSRCGKRLGDGIHTCTPPADILRKAQEK